MKRTPFLVLSFSILVLRFAWTAENAPNIYDRLAISVTGDLLSDIYLQNRKSLVATQAVGARARVQEVQILDVDVRHPDGRSLDLLFHARWTAKGTVGHWGHIHTRKNQYEANINVEPVEGVWKITHLELLEEERIDPYGQAASGKGGMK